MLQTVASERRLVSYEWIMETFGINRFKLEPVLNEITRREKALGRPGLSALVVYKRDPHPGDGFTTWFKDNGFLPTDADDESAYVFWLKELHACWQRWTERPRRHSSRT